MDNYLYITDNIYILSMDNVLSVIYHIDNYIFIKYIFIYLIENYLFMLPIIRLFFLFSKLV